MRIRNIITLKYKSQTSKVQIGKIYAEKNVNSQNYIIIKTEKQCHEFFK